MQKALGEALVRGRVLERIRGLVARGDLSTARPLALAASEARPNDLEVALLARWIHARMDGTSLSSLENLAMKALAAHACLGLPLCILGHVALFRGDDRAAQHLFRRALEAEPALLDARRGAQLAAIRLRSKSAQSSRATRWFFAALAG